MDHNMQDGNSASSFPFLLAGEPAVDPPVVAGVAATLQLLQPDQSHAVGVHLGGLVLDGPSQVYPVKAEATLEANVLVGVGAGVPRVAALLRFSQLLPHITNAAGNPHGVHLQQKRRREAAKAAGPRWRCFTFPVSPSTDR